MPCTATLRQSGGSIILSIPKTIAQTLAVTAGSLVELSVQGRVLSVALAKCSLSDRLAISPSSPARWQREHDWLSDAPPDASCCEPRHAAAGRHSRTEP